MRRKMHALVALVLALAAGGACAQAAWKPDRPVELIATNAPGGGPGALKDVPTWKEQGYDAVIEQWRIFIGPKAMTPGQIAYWDSVFRRMMDAEDWKRELETNFWTANYRASAEARRFLDRDHEDARAFLTELGLAK